MRRWWGIGLGLAVIAILVYFAFFRGRSEKIPAAKIGSAENSPVIDLDPVKAFELINSKGNVRFVKDEQGRWWIEEPGKDFPDPLFFGGMMEVLAELTRKRIVTRADPKILPQYGLDPPTATLIFEFQDTRKKKTLRIGKVNPAVNALYAWYQDEPEVFLLQPKIRMFVVKGFNELRFQKLMRIKSDQAQELKIVVLDPELRKELAAPEVRTLVKQDTSSGPAWLLLDSGGSRNDGGQTANLLVWMERGSFASRILDLGEEELKAWGLAPPRAYFEITFPDRNEKILVGKEKAGLIYLMQENQLKLLGYQKEFLLELLGRDFKIHQLITQADLAQFDRMEVGYPEGKSYQLVKLDQNFWTLGGDAGKKFPARKTAWLYEPFLFQEYPGAIRERPINFENYGLQNPAAKLKFYSGPELRLEIWIGKWESRKAKCYVYVPAQDLLVWYNLNLNERIPPEADAFLAGEKSNRGSGGD